MLVRHPQTGKFLVNFDPQIPEIVRETKCMIKLGLEVPEQAKKIAKVENKLKSNKLRLEVNLEIVIFILERTSISFSKVNLFDPLFYPLVKVKFIYQDRLK